LTVRELEELAQPRAELRGGHDLRGDRGFDCGQCRRAHRRPVKWGPDRVTHVPRTASARHARLVSPIRLVRCVVPIRLVCRVEAIRYLALCFDLCFRCTLGHAAHPSRIHRVSEGESRPSGRYRLRMRCPLWKSTYMTYVMYAVFCSTCAVRRRAVP